MKNDIWEFYLNLPTKFQFWLKSYSINNHLNEELQTL